MLEQAEVAKRFLRFVPEQHRRCGIITPFDASFNEKFVRSFLAANDHSCFQDPRAFSLISSIVNPVRTLINETEVNIVFSR